MGMTGILRGLGPSDQIPVSGNPVFQVVESLRDILRRTMVLPLAGFALGCILFAILGSVVLACIPKLSFSLVNLLWFVVGAFPVTLFLALLYGYAFADSNNELKTGAAILGMYVVMLVGALSGGTILVWLKVHFASTSDRSDKSSSPKLDA